MVQFSTINTTGEKHMKVVTQTELKEILSNLKGAPFCDMVTVTDLSDYQFTDSPFLNKLKKVARYTVQLGVDYKSKMQKIDPSWVAKESRWGYHVNNILVEHKGKFYIACCIQKKHFDFLKVGRDKITEEIKKEIQPYLKPLDHDEKNPISYRRFKLDSIKQITIHNVSYLIV